MNFKYSHVKDDLARPRNIITMFHMCCSVQNPDLQRGPGDATVVRGASDS